MPSELRKNGQSARPACQSLTKPVDVPIWQIALFEFPALAQCYQLGKRRIMLLPAVVLVVTKAPARMPLPNLTRYVQANGLHVAREEHLAPL